MNNLIHDQVIATCGRTNIKELVGFKYDWNTKVVAQFYATLYVEEAGDVRQIHLMIQGRSYSISFSKFARLFCF